MTKIRSGCGSGAAISQIGITVASLCVLTLIFFFQNFSVRRPTVYTWVRAPICCSFWSG
jgi:transcriptional regulator of nitric oxide reductase